MLTGTPPFRAETALAVALKHVKDTAVRPIVHRPEIPAELERLVLKLMEKKPKDRYQSAAEMLRDLGKIRDSIQATTTTLTDTEQQQPPATGTATATPMAVGAAIGPRSPRPSLRIRPRSARPRGRARKARLAAVRLSGGQTAALISVCLVIGLAWGWLTRVPDLIAESTAEPTTLPALWMVPECREIIPKQGSPEAQYRYAQLHVAKADQEGAWLAVPGHFPSRAMGLQGVHPARPGAPPPPRRRPAPGVCCRAQPLACRPDARARAGRHRAGRRGRPRRQDRGRDRRSRPKNLDPKTVIDPALLELSLEVTRCRLRTRATTSAEVGTGVPRGLREIQANLLQKAGHRRAHRRPAVEADSVDPVILAYPPVRRVTEYLRMAILKTGHRSPRRPDHRAEGRRDRHRPLARSVTSFSTPTG